MHLTQSRHLFKLLSELLLLNLGKVPRRCCHEAIGLKKGDGGFGRKGLEGRRRARESRDRDTAPPEFSAVGFSIPSPHLMDSPPTFEMQKQLLLRDRSRGCARGFASS